jgi:predicted  nucleic acid-binding Zn-ribbon protein
MELEKVRWQQQLTDLQAELSDLKQNSATASIDLPDAGDLLNELKSKRKKSTVTLADVEKILEILEGGFDTAVTAVMKYNNNN